MIVKAVYIMELAGHVAKGMPARRSCPQATFPA